MEYSLPDGFRWTEMFPEYLEFEHVASGWRGAVSHCERSVTPKAEIQQCVDCAVHKAKVEIARNMLWQECGGDPEQFRRFRVGRKDYELAATL